MENPRRKKRSDKTKNKFNKFGKYNRRHIRIILSEVENGKLSHDVRKRSNGRKSSSCKRNS